MQRAGLGDGREFENRQPVTEVDDCNIAENIFISQIYYVLLELKLNKEQKVENLFVSPAIAKPDVIRSLICPETPIDLCYT